MANTIGYARVSTLEQNEALQVDALMAAGAVRVFVEKASGTTRQRPELERCLDYLNAGDALAVWRIDRLGRSTADLVAIVTELNARGVQFRSVTEGIDTTTPGGELVFTIFAAIAQMERRLIAERTRAGLAAARERGRVGGRPRVVSGDQVTEAVRMRADGRTIEEIATMFKVGRTTLGRYLAERDDCTASV